jgi:Mrp family chromosome partitioning ATPase
MSTFGELLREIPLSTKAVPLAADGRVGPRTATSQGISVREEQIQALIQQLFSQQEGGPVRNVAFTPVEPSAQTAPLCIDLAKALASEGKHDIGLIDASSDAVPLQRRLQVEAPARSSNQSRDPSKDIWPVASRLWLVPWQSWSKGVGLHSVTDQDLGRLRDLMVGFDFCILYCAPVSWLTARIAQSCDGIVLVLTANKTRRLVAAEIKEQLTKAHIPLLGTVLAERRLPVPQGLYRKL